jgi:cobalt/nickel transport system permease protein
LEARDPAVDSPIGRLDPRIKILTALALISIIVSEPRTELRAFVFDFAMLAAAAAVSRIPVREIFRRAGLASPFILAAAVMFPLSQSGGGLLASGPCRQALTMALKAYASVLAMSLFVLTDRLGRLLGAMRSLGFPATLGSVMTLAGRFLDILGDEAVRMKRARESRTPGRLRVSRVQVVGRAGAALFAHGWRRAQAVQAAMEARGFDGSFPDLNPSRLGLRDALAAVAFLVPFVAVRVFLP